MTENQSVNKMVAKPVQKNLIRPAAPASKVAEEESVAIRTVRAIKVKREGQDVIVEPGQEVMVTPSEAKEFCDTVFKAHHAFAGERYEADFPDGKHPVHEIKRAVRL